MANLYNPDQGDTPPADDTRLRFPHNRPQRYPIGVRVLVVNGAGASYDCVEVDAAGTALVPTTTHLAVNNIGTETLVVNDVTLMYFDVTSRSFFLARRARYTPDNILRGYMDDDLKIEQALPTVWTTYSKVITTGVDDNQDSHHGQFATTIGSATVSSLLDAYASLDFDFTSSNTNSSTLQNNAAPGANDFIKVAGTHTWTGPLNISWSHSITGQAGHHSATLIHIMIERPGAPNNPLRLESVLRSDPNGIRNPVALSFARIAINGLDAPIGNLMVHTDHDTDISFSHDYTFTIT